MGEYSGAFVGFDTSKTKHAVAIAEGGRGGEVRFLGEIASSPVRVERLVGKLASRYDKLHFCYEAGPTGYGLYRQIRELGHDCTVAAPLLIPKRPGERIKTNRRDAVTLARLLRAGELTAVWVPDAVHEAVRDLVRARAAAAQDLRRKRQQLLSFLLRHGRIFSGRQHWTLAHRRWLAEQSFAHPAQQVVFQDAVEAIAESPGAAAAPGTAARRDRAELVDGTGRRSLSGDARRLVSGGRHLRRRDRGCAPLRQSAAIDGVSRARPRRGSTGETIRRAGLTLAGNRHAQRVLVEAAWSYRHPARVSPTLRARLEGLPKPVRDTAWKAQVRLCARYRRLSAAGKKLPVVIAAIAREMAAFLWAIARHVAPAV